MPNNALGNVSPFAGIKILIVDDQFDIAEMLRLTLQIRGAEARAFTSVKEALEILKSWVPNVLISDLSMPDQNGYDLISAIRSSPPPLKDIPAIALSGVFEGSMALKSGYSSFVKKPVAPSQLADALLKLLGKQP